MRSERKLSESNRDRRSRAYEALAFVTRGLDACTSERALAIRRTTSKAHLDVFALVSNNATKYHVIWSERLLNNRIGVGLLPHRAAIPESLRAFAGPRSAHTKPAFLLWVANLPPRYKNVWHVEDDVLFSGPWGRILHTRDEADILAHSCRVRPKSWYFSRNGAASDTNGGLCTFDNKPCSAFAEARVDGRFLRIIFWPIVRMSTLYLSRLTAHLLAHGSTTSRGHHEALVAIFCSSMGANCTMRSLPTHLIGRFELGGAPGASRIMDVTAPDKVYHPYKCGEAMNLHGSVRMPARTGQKRGVT